MSKKDKIVFLCHLNRTENFGMLVLLTILCSVFVTAFGAECHGKVGEFLFIWGQGSGYDCKGDNFIKKCSCLLCQWGSILKKEDLLPGRIFFPFAMDSFFLKAFALLESKRGHKLSPLKILRKI